jgi:hypothetical protein
MELQVAFVNADSIAQEAKKWAQLRLRLLLLDKQNLSVPELVEAYDNLFYSGLLTEAVWFYLVDDKMCGVVHDRVEALIEADPSISTARQVWREQTARYQWTAEAEVKK